MSSTNIRSFAAAIQNIFSLSASTQRGTLNLRFGWREESLYSASNKSNHRPSSWTCSGCTPCLTQDTKYSCCNDCAFTKSTFFGKRHIILTSTLCRIMLYHKINPSLTTMHCLFFPPPWYLRRSQLRWKPHFLLKYCCPRLGVLLLNRAKQFLLVCSATADVASSTTAEASRVANKDECRSSSVGHANKTRIRANL